MKVSLRLLAVFKVLVLWRQNELSGPPKHCIIAITWSHDSPDALGAFKAAGRGGVISGQLKS